MTSGSNHRRESDVGVRCRTAGARAMMRTGGSIVLVSSAAARIGLANHEAIAAAKSGVIGLTLAAAILWARGIRVNCVAPGLVRTPLTARLTANETSLKASEAMHALGRIGEPADVAPRWRALDSAQGWVTDRCSQSTADSQRPRRGTA